MRTVPKPKTFLALAAVFAMAVSAGAQSRPADSTFGVTVIPAGTQLQVRINDDLSSATAQEGDRFSGVLVSPIVVNDTTLFPAGAEVKGSVLEAAPSGRLSSSGVLKLTLRSLQSGPKVANINTEPFLIQGESHTKSNTTKIGGGAALGAIIGAVAGGAKGAAIGATVGAGAGAGAAAATGKREATVEPEAELQFVTAYDARVTTLSPEQQQERRREETPTLQTRPGSPTNTATEPPVTQTAQAGPSQGQGKMGSTPSPAPSAKTPEEAGQNLSANGRNLYIFNLRDKRVINHCIAENRSQLPAGLTDPNQVPAGLERELVRNGQLPAALQRKVQSLPYACERQLPPLPEDVERVIYANRVMLLNSASRILDIFPLDLR